MPKTNAQIGRRFLKQIIVVSCGLITLVACSLEAVPLKALAGRWNVNCAVVEIREGRKQRTQFGEDDIQMSQRKKAIYIPLDACPGGRHSMLLLYHDRDNVYRLLHSGAISVLSARLDIPTSGKGVALRYAEAEGFVAKDATRAITFRDKGDGTYEMHFSNVRTMGDVTMVEMRLIRK